MAQVTLNVGTVTNAGFGDFVPVSVIVDSREYGCDAELMSERTLEESDIELTEIAVAVPISYSSSIDILYGEGYPIRQLEFAYQSGEGEGVRTLGFFDAFTDLSKIKISDMGVKAIAESDIDLDEFLKNKGNGSVAKIPRKVQRDEEATTGAPHVPEAPKLETPIPKQTSWKVSDVVEGFLG